MTYPKARPIMIAILLVATSIAGCLSTEDNVEKDTVYTSTWHIQDLVENIAGDFVNVELLAPTNVPVHDYEPTSTDLLYLRDADLFFYHGLGLETWVNTTLETMGDDAPKFVEVHTLPDGSIVLEYEVMLIADLCEHLNDGPFENSNLTHGEEISEIHAEHVAHRLSFPMHDDDHDDHDDDHDDHDGDHDDHDNHTRHAEHNHLVPEETIDDPAGCPTDSVIQMYHMEEGHYMLEFEAEEMMSFDMSVLKMLGGHANHDHGDHGDEGHDDHSDEEEDNDEGDHDNHSDEDREQVRFDSIDLNNDSQISWDEFWNSFIEDDHHDEHNGTHDEHSEHMVCFNSEMNMISGLDNETSCESYVYMTNMSWGDTTFTGCYNPVSHAADPNMSAATCDAFMWVDEGDVEERNALMASFHRADANNDSLLNLTELGPFIEMVHIIQNPHDERHGMYGAISIHIDVEGDYGFALPHDVTMHVMPTGHDGHAGHDDHDGHSDEERDRDGHSDEEGDHDDHSDEEGDHDDHGEEESGRFDPHSWLDPLSYRAQAALVRDALIEAFPEGEADFTANAEAYMAELLTLHEEFSSALAACEVSDIVANHNAYAYLAERYDLQFVTVHGIDPEGEPTAADIAEVVEAIEEDDITTMYVEEFTDPASLSSLVEQTKSGTMPEGVTLMTLHTMELPPKDANDGYTDLMKENLDNLLAGMTC